MVRRWMITAGLGVALLWNSPAASADNPLSFFDGRLTLSASDRMRGEFVSWFDPAGPRSNNGYSFFANRLRAGAALTLPMVDMFVEGQDTRLVNLPGSDSIAPLVGPLGPGATYFATTRTRDQGEVLLHRAYATIHDFGLRGVSVRGGRIGYNHGMEKPPADPTLLWLQRERISQRLIGNFDYTNVGRSFDGLQGMYDNERFNFTAMASHPTQGGFNVNANTHIDDIDLVSLTATLLEDLATGPMSGQFFGIYYRDRRDLVVPDNRPLTPAAGCAAPGAGDDFRSCDDGTIAIMTIGMNLTHAIDLGPGRLDLLLWSAGQVGNWESLDQESWAYALETGYQFPKVAWKPWVRLGFFRSSGDDNPNDGDHGTFFQILPTARLYAALPFFNMMNSQELFLQGILKPLDGLTVQPSVHWLRVTESADLWYSGSGAASDTFFGFGGIPSSGAPNGRPNELAYLLDLGITYTLNRHLEVYGYYGHAFGQGVVSAAFDGNDADYGYLETTLSF